MELGDVILAVAALWGAYRVGQLSIVLPMSRLVKEAIEDGRLDPKILEDDEQDAELDEVLRFERVGQQYFAYAVSTGHFLAQGPDFLSLFQTIKDRFPGKSFRVNKKQEDFTEEEVGSMIQGIFQVFGDKDDNNSKARQ